MKCKYWKTCDLYKKESVTCNQNAGVYHEDRPARCYIRMQEKEDKIKEDNLERKLSSSL